MVVDWPNTAERMRGRDNYLAVQRAYPEGWHIEVLRIVDGGDVVVSEVRVDQDDQRFFAASFFEVDGDRIVERRRVLVGWRADARARVARPVDGAALSELDIRHAEPDDHARVMAVLDEWWGGRRRMRDMLPRLFFVHFRDTSFVAERDGELAGFLVGFLSQSRAGRGLRPLRRRQPGASAAPGSGRELYERFFAAARAEGRTRVSCVTSPANAGSLAFHRAIGFEPSPPQAGYDGPGEDRVVLTRSI